MNYRTTFILAILLAVLALGYLAFRPGVKTTGDVSATTPPAIGGSSVARDVLEQKPEDVVKIVCRQAGQEKWVFEKTARDDQAVPAQWHMTEPLAVEVAASDVDRIVRQISGLRYELSYRPGEAGAPTSAEAGLDPPRASVQLVGADEHGVVVEVGKPATDLSTYVRVPDREEIYVAMSSLKDLLKESALDYRDRLLWNFAPERATRIEIEDRSETDMPVAYVLTNDLGRWILEKPVAARATSKVADMVNAMSQLRVIKWHDNRPDRLAAYGLEPAAWTIRVTVAEPAADADPDQEDPKEDDASSEPASVTYVLHLSDQSPIGEETKLYMRGGDESMVGTVMKYTTDKLMPDLSQWREMKVAAANLTAATRVEVTTPEKEVVLIKTGGGWSFDEDNGPAEQEAVEELLQAVGDLRAVAFVDGEPSDTAGYGLDEPRAVIQLTIPGLEAPERIAVGDYSDKDTKRLVYVRRNNLASIAKVRSADVEKLTRPARAYRDRTIMDIPPMQFDGIEIGRIEACTGQPVSMAFKRQDANWTMTAPVAADVQSDRMDELVEALSELRAEAIVAESGQLTAYGLHEPTATVAVSFRPLVDTDETGPGQPESGAATETWTVHVADHDGRCFAAREGRSAIYEVSRSLFNLLTAEFRAADGMDFEPLDVTRFSIRTADRTFAFERDKDVWVYEAEPDLPLDKNKVDNLLLQLKDLKAERYVAYGVDDLSAYGLSSPATEVSVKLADGTEMTLSVAGTPCENHPADGLYANRAGNNEVFLLKPDQLARLEVRLPELEKSP